MTTGVERRRYMLDTNTASYIIKGNPPVVRARLLDIPMADVCVSVITQAELLLGVERKPGAGKLRETVREFLLRVEILPWDSDAAEMYAQLRADCERNGKSLGSMDMLIAAHSAAAGTILVSSDRAFRKASPNLKLEDWTLSGRSS